MRAYPREHLTDRELLHVNVVHLSGENEFLAEVLADFAEIDQRRLFLAAGYTSMRAYCVGLGLSEDQAQERIRAARVAREFPAVLGLIADRRLNLTAVCMLSPHLTRENAGDLLQEATGKTGSQIQELVRRYAPRNEMMPMVEALPAPHEVEVAARRLALDGVERITPESERAPREVAMVAPEKAATPRSRTAPIAEQRFALHLTMGKDIHEKLVYAQGLLSHTVPSGDLVEVFDRALDALIERLEKQKFAATSRPQPARPCTNPRTIPAEVRRAVWQRDGGRCTFVGEVGHRCEERSLLEYDHIEPVARGGRSTLEGIRLRCRAHNQYEAERLFGARFMEEKREARAGW